MTANRIESFYHKEADTTSQSIFIHHLIKVKALYIYNMSRFNSLFKNWIKLCIHSKNIKKTVLHMLCHTFIHKSKLYGNHYKEYTKFEFTFIYSAQIVLNLKQKLVFQHWFYSYRFIKLKVVCLNPKETCDKLAYSLLVVLVYSGSGSGIHQRNAKYMPHK